MSANPAAVNIILCIITNQRFTLSQDSSVSKVSGYWLYGLGSIVNCGRKFSLHHHIQTASDEHPAFYPMGTDSPFPKHIVDWSTK